MKNRIWLIILIVAVVGLVVALFATKKRADEEKAKANDTILDFSNRLDKTSISLADQRAVNVTLTNDLSVRNEQILNLTNKLVETSDNLAKTADSLKTAVDDIAKRDAKINDLENQNQELDKKALDLSNTITNLNGQIAETQRKLDSAEGDKEFLGKELQRLMAEKAELEKRFNDLEVMRAQVKKLKEELSVARRLDWIRRGIFGDQKGAEVMMQPNSADRSAAKTNDAPRYNLNVEVDADGSVRVIPAQTNDTPVQIESPAATNAPASTNQ